MNLIDRDKLKDEWENNYLVVDEMVDHNNMVDCVIVSIDAQPTANDWTSVERELPEHGEEVLVVDIDKVVHIAKRDANIGDWDCRYFTYSYEDVIAWKPIEPYTGDKE